MEVELLIQRLRYPLRKVDVEEYARIFSDYPKGDELMFNLTIGFDETVKLHTAWIFELIVMKNKSLQVKWFYPIINSMPQVKNQSVRRFFVKQIKNILQNKHLRRQVDEEAHSEEFERLAEICFDWMLDPSAIVSVQSVCIDALICLIPTNNWVREELPQVVSNLASMGTPAVKCKLRYIKAYING